MRKDDIMTDTDAVIRARLTWVLHYQQTGNAGITCRRCGISRPTLRKWWRRYQTTGEEGLRSLSRRRHTLPLSKVTQEHRETILSFCNERRLGPKRIKSELLRTQHFSLSTATIWKVLHTGGAKPLRRPKLPEVPIRYSRPVPGDRVQMDTMKIRDDLFQFTAVDDCTRMRVLGLYPARTAENAVHFLEERVLEEFPFPIQRVQTDRGGEFFGTVFQQVLRDNSIKFRPNRPAAPHLNGKVERSQQTDRMEFWSTVDVTASLAALAEPLDEWQQYYNWERPHSSLGGKPPLDLCCELLETTPFSDEIAALYFDADEPWRERDYQLDLQQLKLKRSQ
jgi:transposase InsO family protein